MNGTLSQVFEDLFRDALTRNRALQQMFTGDGTYIPWANAYETENAYHIQLFLPGIKKEDVSIEIDENVLQIEGDMKFSAPENGKTLLEEFQGGKFRRFFRLPQEVELEKIEATYQDGILTILIPKKQKEVKKIKVEVK